MQYSTGFAGPWHRACVRGRSRLCRTALSVSKHALWCLQAVREKGIQSVAVVLKNSYLFPDHERQVGELASELGFSQVPGASSTLKAHSCPMCKCMVFCV